MKITTTTGYRPKCPAPGCGKRRVTAATVAGIRFCNTACAVQYVHWLYANIDKQRQRLAEINADLPENVRMEI